MILAIPIKPFPNYKWRWASYQPTEGLLRPDVYLGILRAFGNHEGERPSSPDLAAALRVVQQETQTDINLARNTERNLIRNSGQYWKGPGLLETANGKIELTDFGKQVAAGRITDSEFALAVVKTLALPNARIDTNETIGQWKAAEVEIKPLELLLSILGQLENSLPDGQAYITANELIQITIPLAGVKTSLQDHADALVAHRQGQLNLADWPDCAPAANDKRMAREFLLFLWNHGLCRCEKNTDASRYNQKFFSSSFAAADVTQLEKIIAPSDDVLAALANLRKSQLPATVDESRRVSRPTLSRPRQAAFRRDVLKAYQATCLLTGEKIAAVLEAAHIIGKEHSGADTANNGICLRADIHKLFDAGHIRIEPDGQMHYSDAISSSISYQKLPEKIKIPSFVTQYAIEWRWRYN